MSKAYEVVSDGLEFQIYKRSSNQTLYFYCGKITTLYNAQEIARVLNEAVDKKEVSS